VVSKRHVVEPYELPPSERAAFWEEATTVASALARVFRAAKMNYEIHGNVIPHLHLHLYPRAVDDSYDTGTLGPPRGAFTRSDELLAQMAAALGVQQ
jgi:diadenosine tetraphosphate (Ap4A) HIT family hydrolase